MSGFEITRADGSSRKVQGYRASKSKDSAKRYVSKRSELPAKVDLRPLMTAVESQGDTMSCTANAVAGAYEYLQKMHLDDSYDVSRLFVYYNARDMDDEYDEIEDAGSCIDIAVESLSEYGICAEETWPFDEDIVNDEPDEGAYEEAADFLVEDFSVVDVDLNAWKSALADGYPIIFGLSLYNSFDNHRKPGLVPMPTKKEVARADHSGHAMLCVGYSEPDQVFIVRNSWGKGWGDKGYCYLPYRYVINEDYNDGDSWVIRRLADIGSEETWHDDEDSILDEYENELTEMSDEDYEDMLDDMGDVALESRIAIVLLRAATADEDISDDELDEIASYLGEILEGLGSNLSANKVLRFSLKHTDDDELLGESIELLGDYLSGNLLGQIAEDIEKIISVDELEDAEYDFVTGLIEKWQIEDQFY